MPELVQEIQKIIKYELNNFKVELKNELKSELKTELKNELRAELRKDFNEELNQQIGNLRDEFNDKFDALKDDFNELKDDVRVLRDCLFVVEHEHGQKIDAIYDLVCLDKEVNAPKFEKINKISDKVDKNQLHILNHENRISNLEKYIS